MIHSGAFERGRGGGENEAAAALKTVNDGAVVFVLVHVSPASMGLDEQHLALGIKIKCWQF
jgi:hypothetical protein